MPSFIRNTSGGASVSGGALAPRSRRGNTNQADAYWRGGVLDVGAFQSIATTILTTSTPNITFSVIPQGYKHLQLRVFGRSTGAYTYSSVYVQPNSDSGLNYSFHALTGDGATATANGRGTGSDVAWTVQNITGNNATANNYGMVIIDIFDYTNTNKYKTMRSFGGYDNNGSGTPIGTANNNSSVWLSTTAITSLSLATDGDFMQYTHAALYGIEG